MNVRAGLADYERVENDAYFSRDPCIGNALVWALREFGLDPTTITAWEPCAGAGDLMHQLERHGMTVAGSDLHQHIGADARIGAGARFDMFTRVTPVPDGFTLITTNPPFNGRMP